MELGLFYVNLYIRDEFIFEINLNGDAVGYVDEVFNELEIVVKVLYKIDLIVDDVMFISVFVNL